MIRAALISAFWCLYLVVASFVAFPVTFITRNIDLLWRVAMTGARAGVWLAGVRATVIGREKLHANQTYLFMPNHVSNIDPPLLVPLIGRRISVIGKQELFRIPLFGTAMRLGNFVPVDRSRRESAIESVRSAVGVLHSGLSMLIYPEGTRSVDGKLLPFKKGAFHLAAEARVPVVPITMVGVHEIWPKGKFCINPGKATIIFHDPIDPTRYQNREELMMAVREAIQSGFDRMRREVSV